MKNSVITLLLIAGLFIQLPLLAQGIKGTVKGDKGQPLPYVSIFITNLNTGASSNENGEFEIKLPAGKHTLVVQFIGFKAQQTDVIITNDWVTKNFTLQEQGFALKEVEVRNKKEDPAYTIMRKAIAKRKYHLLQYDNYQMKVYTKGTGEVTKVPFFLKKKLEEEGVILNEAHTFESVSLVAFEQPDKITERVISARNTGTNEGTPSPSIFINESFYKDKIGDAISPLARTAFAYYKFEYAGSFEEGAISVNKIKVTPRSRGDQVFEGYIYIIENLWAIHSLDLKTSIMGFPVRVRQNYTEIEPTLWMPVTHKIDVSGKAMGFAGGFKYLVSISDYKVKLNQDLVAVQTEILDEKVDEVPEAVAAIEPTKIDDPALALLKEDKLTRKQFRKMIVEYEKEALQEQKQPEVVSERTFKVDSLANKRDSAYWSSARPVPLSEKEIRGYQRGDSLALIREAKLTGKDSANVIKKTGFMPQHILVGSNYNLSPRTSFNLHPTVAQVYYNTVEGFNFNMSGRLRHQYDSLRQTVDFTPSLRYGLASEDFYAKAALSHKMVKGVLTRIASLESGKFVQQFSDDEPIHPHINTLSSLLFRKNYMKLYEKMYVKAAYAYKPFPFLSISGSLEWAQRNELLNQTNYSFFFKDERNFSSNRPDNEEINENAAPEPGSTGFPKHEALVLEANLSYRPGGTYRIYNGKKIPLLDKSPEFLLKYRKGINGLLSSDVNFDQVELGLNHQVALGVSGRLQFELRAGTFLNNKSTFFMDYHHFDGNRTILSSIKPAGSFRLLDYYQYSTNNAYFSAHTYYRFRKFLLTQIPEVRFAGIKESIFFNYLKTGQSPHYYEVGYSLENVFRVFRVEAATSFANGQFKEVGIRISVSSLIQINKKD